MHLEEQRWAPVAAACAPPIPVTDTWYVPGEAGVYGWISFEPQPDKFWPPETFLQFELGRPAIGGSPWCGCYLAKSCTEFAAYPKTAWRFFYGANGAAVNAAVQESGFGPARFIDLDLDPGGDVQSGVLTKENLSVVAVPNQGSAWRKWWWSGSAGATAKQLTDVINGKAWPAGNFKQDNIPKKLVALARSKLDGKFRFVVNEWKPGEAWWWGYGASIDNITAVLKGQAWADFRNDGIEKRLVLLKRHGKDNWTFIMVPRNGLGWAWHPYTDITSLRSEATANDQRVIALNISEPWPSWGYTLSAILVQNA